MYNRQQQLILESRKNFILFLFSPVLEIEPKASCMLDKTSTLPTELHLRSKNFIFKDHIIKFRMPSYWQGTKETQTCGCQLQQECGAYQKPRGENFNKLI